MAESTRDFTVYLADIESSRQLVNEYFAEIVELGTDAPGVDWRVARMLALVAEMVQQVALLAVAMAPGDEAGA